MPPKRRKAATAFWPSGDSDPRPGSDCSIRSVAMLRLTRALSRVPIFGSGVAIGAAEGAVGAELGGADGPPLGGREGPPVAGEIFAPGNGNYCPHRPRTRATFATRQHY